MPLNTIFLSVLPVLISCSLQIEKCYVDNLLNKNKFMSIKIPIPPKDIQEMFELNYFFNYLENINTNSIEINKKEIIC